MNVRPMLGLSFDDVLLVPKYSFVPSRKDVKLNTRLTRHYNLDTPIISANMQAVTEWELAAKLGSVGGLGVLHRFMNDDKLREQCNYIHLLSASVPFGISVGVNVVNIDLIKEIQTNKNCALIVIDVAHGHHAKVFRTLELLKKNNIYNIMVGNVATTEAAWALCDAGADALKVGIGPGSQCTTRLQTGHGVPQLTAIQEVVAAADRFDVPVCADGGIRNSGDIVKAIAAGADTVMVGKLFAACPESPAEITYVDEEPYKIYMGSASSVAKCRAGLGVNHIEGKETLIKVSAGVEDVFYGLCDGIRSGFSYSGALDINNFRKNAEFIRVTPNDHHLKQ
jgi:IMP dehydrogenase